MMSFHEDHKFAVGLPVYCYHNILEYTIIYNDIL